MGSDALDAPGVPDIPPARRIFANRTLNLRSIRAIGYDMDYTLVHYRVDAWEGAAFAHARIHLGEQGWPIDDLVFDPDSVIRGLTIDTELGNLLKVTRFGYVIRAAHGTQVLDFDAQRRTYSRVLVDLAESRYQFMNTLFSLSEACLYAQLVDLIDQGRAPNRATYSQAHRAVQQALGEAHLGGELKAEILSDRERFIELEPEIPLALLDQKHAGKKLLLITNSDWSYSREIMAHTFDPYLPGDMTWRELFDIVVVDARKPRFFADRDPLYRVVDETQGHLLPEVRGMSTGVVFSGGHAGHIEDALGLRGDQILYVGDHLFGDVHVSKAVLRWRTALVLRELESEVTADLDFRADEARLADLMGQKRQLERNLAGLRLLRQRHRHGYALASDGAAPTTSQIDDVREALSDIDDTISPLAQAAGQLRNEQWGPLMRAGNDKSFFARQVERHADIYLSRVSNFALEGPTAYLRAARSSLPHDADPI